MKVVIVKMPDGTDLPFDFETEPTPEQITTAMATIGGRPPRK